MHGCFRGLQITVSARLKRKRLAFPLAGIRALGLLGLLLLPLPSLSVSPPNGWEYQPQDGFVSYHPKALGPRTFMLMVLNPAAASGSQPLAAWGEALSEQLSKSYGQIRRRDPVESGASLWSVTHHLDGRNGQALFATYTAIEGKGGYRRMAVMLGEPGLIGVHGNAASELLAEILAEDPQARIRLARPGLAERGHGNARFGEEFVFGRYYCKVENGRYPYSVTLDLYPNLEYRSDRRDHKTGSYRYDPGNASFDLEADYHLLDYQLFDDDEHSGIVSVYFRDARGKAWLYGEHFSDNEATLCEHQGPSVLASPAEEAAAKAEERRFKWTTAPDQGVALADIEAIVHSAEHKNDSLGIRLEEEHLLLLKDGWAYSGLRVTPADLDVVASRKNEPERWQRWRMEGGQYQVEHKGQWQDVPGISARPATRGERLSGAYSHSSMYGNIYTTAHTFKDSLYFKSDGTLSSSSSVRGGTTAMNTGTFSANVASDRVGGDIIRYELNGYTLIRHYPDGETTRSLAYFWGDGQEHLSINGTTYTRN